jgi:hypothetical protein
MRVAARLLLLISAMFAAGVLWLVAKALIKVL